MERGEAKKNKGGAVIEEERTRTGDQREGGGESGAEEGGLHQTLQLVCTELQNGCGCGVGKAGDKKQNGRARKKDNGSHRLCR